MRLSNSTLESTSSFDKGETAKVLDSIRMSCQKYKSERSNKNTILVSDHKKDNNSLKFAPLFYKNSRNQGNGVNMSMNLNPLN